MLGADPYRALRVAEHRADEIRHGARAFDRDRSVAGDAEQAFRGDRREHRAVAEIQQRGHALRGAESAVGGGDAIFCLAARDDEEAIALGAREHAPRRGLGDAIDLRARDAAELPERHDEILRLEPYEARTRRAHEDVALAILDQAVDLRAQLLAPMLGAEQAAIGHPDAQAVAEPACPQIAARVLQQIERTADEVRGPVDRAEDGAGRIEVPDLRRPGDPHAAIAGARHAHRIPARDIIFENRDPIPVVVPPQAG